MELLWHKYKYYPYERELAVREANALLSPRAIQVCKSGLKIDSPENVLAAERLVYFLSAETFGVSTPTIQARLERINGAGSGKQSTRYSVHGLHEYKGKFNPQMARAILNILHVPEGSRVLDPFCGSGTTLVECAHMGMEAVGTDINPLAVFLANAKLSALCTPATTLKSQLDAVTKAFKCSGATKRLSVSDERLTYLCNWFDEDTLSSIEALRSVILTVSQHPDILLAIASNLLRDYSLQEPLDLRIRRRKSPLPTTPFFEAYVQAAGSFITRLNEAQLLFPKVMLKERAYLIDSREIKLGVDGLDSTQFDCALTSPPYATALPYIDTQRLSLVWLGLLQPSKIMTLESELVGSREANVGAKRELLEDLLNNRAGLPSTQASYCLRLQDALTEVDGFRRQAVPRLLYRYFAGMAKTFGSVNMCMKRGSYFALIVGSNHTTLGGTRFDIDTPQHLAELAEANGWVHHESIPLQTYQRYGLHQGNAVSSEALVILKKL